MLEFLLLCMIQSQPGGDASHRVLVPGVQWGDPQEHGDDFDWASRDAIAFLERLKSRRHYTVTKPHESWVRRKDLPRLIELLESREACAAVSMAISSLHTGKLSTIGNEAAFLVRGYREGRYPPDLNSDRQVVTEEDKVEIKKWWASYVEKQERSN